MFVELDTTQGKVICDIDLVYCIIQAGLYYRLLLNTSNPSNFIEVDKNQLVSIKDLLKIEQRTRI